MLAALLVTAAWLPSLWGLGDVVARGLRARDLGLATTGLLGLSALAAIGTVVHMFAPLGPAVSGVVFLIGLIAFARDGRRLVSGTPRATWIAMAAVLVAIAAASGLPVRQYDMALYWLQSVRWVTESPQPLGIASLHGRLALNSTWFTVCGLLELPFAVQKSAFVAPALVCMFGAWLSAEGVRDVVARRGGSSAWLALSTGLLVASLAQFLGGHAPDAAAALLAFAALVSWARTFDGDVAKPEHARAAVLLGAFAATVKLSAAVWLAASPLLLLLLARRGLGRRDAARPAIAAAILLAPWVLTGYLASGCPLFPSSVGCLALPWAAPPSIPETLGLWTRSWARIPEATNPAAVLADWDWVEPWAAATWEDTTVRILAGVLAVGTVAVVATWRARSQGFLVLIGIAAAAVAFWFVTAPALRFGWGPLFALALVPASEAAARLGARRRWAALVAGAAGAVLAVALASTALEWTRQAPPGSIRETYSPLTWPAIPSSAYREVATRSGLHVWLPAYEDQCADAPRPCTPYFDPGLSLDGRTFTTTTASPMHP